MEGVGLGCDWQDAAAVGVDMADRWSTDKRSEVMSHIRSKDTVPERLIRCALHRRGFRFRLHDKGLPGHPDLVFRKHGAVVFIHGCFWHQHRACRDGRIPDSRQEYWEPKLKRNVERDALAQERLQQLGWRVYVLWECEVREDLPGVIERVERFLLGS